MDRKMQSKHAYTIAFIALMCAPASYATLFDRGSGLVYDDDLDVTWLKNANVHASSRGGLVYWSTASSWAADLAYVDEVRNRVWTDWQLPSTQQMSHLFYTELGGVLGYDLRFTHNANYYLFDNIQPGPYWTSTAWSSNPNEYHEVFDFYLGNIYSKNKNNEFSYAWALRHGDVAPVPEPSGLLMILAGIAAISIFRRSPSAQRLLTPASQPTE